VTDHQYTLENRVKYSLTLPYKQNGNLCSSQSGLTKRNLLCDWNFNWF